MASVNVVYAFGMNEDGQCGAKKDQKDIELPIVIRFPSKVRIVALSAGSRHSLALSEEGSVYSWGWGHIGQLGHGENNVSVSNPTRISRLQNVVQVSAGGMHSACVDKNNRCYTWGSNTYGQLGLGSGPALATVNTPTVVKYGDDDLITSKVCCGGMHTVALGPKGELYGWGKADSGQIGYSMWYSTFNTCVAEPKLVTELDETVVDISCGSFYTLILTAKGMVYAMGKEDYGCLGIGDDESMSMSSGVQSPTLLSYFKKSTPIQQISAGGWHSGFLTTEGELFVSGKGEYGRLGLGNEAAKLSPTRVVMPQQEGSDHLPIVSNIVAQVSAGGSHTIWATIDHHIFTVGRLDGGRCGVGSYAGNTRITLGHDITTAFFHHSDYPFRVLQVKAGGAHSMILVQYEQVPESAVDMLMRMIEIHSSLSCTTSSTTTSNTDSNNNTIRVPLKY